MKADQLGEQLEHADRLGIVQMRRTRVDGAEGAEEGAVRQDDRHREIALEAIERRGVMAAEGFVLGHVVDDDGLPGLADLVADRSLDLQLAAGLKSELNIVT